MTSNIVEKDTLRRVQLETLEALHRYLSQSFGPYGSNTIQYKKEGYPRYTKDGHTILKSIMFGGEIEQAVLADIEEETRAQAKRVGDSTTSVTILSYLIFKKLTERIEKQFTKTPPADIVRALKEVVDAASTIIKAHGREVTLDDIRKISLISTNNDEKLAEEIVNVHKDLGLNAYIDVMAGSGEEFVRKTYDGMFFDCGYHDACFINMPEKSVNRIENPRIYYFEDPIDTVSYGELFDTIIAHNIINPINEMNSNRPNNNEIPQIIPTVIIAPKIVRDYARTLEVVMSYCAKFAQANLPNTIPLNIITGVTDTDKVYLKNILNLCGVPTINKYDDAKAEARDQRNGTAPSIKNVWEWYGTAGCVESGAFSTKLIDPKNYKNEDGTYTDVFNAVLNDLDARIAELEKQHNETLKIYQYKKQKNSLLGNMVELYVGGITIADRDQVRDLVEDAVLNCRSAVNEGVGYGANFEGLRAFKALMDVSLGDGSLKEEIVKCFYEAYKEISELLYRYMDDPEGKVALSLAQDCPFDVRTGEKGENVLSSIDTDICVLNSISKIISLMVTANQFQMSNLNINKY